MTVFAAVAADNVICSNIGRDILLRGGNAVEAAIATAFCIGIQDPHSAGLGGGHLMTIYNATTKKCHVVDAREVAPLNSTENIFFNRKNASKYGYEAVAVPGELHGFWTEYKNFGGNLEWKTLVEPAIQLLEEGSPTSHVLARQLQLHKQQILSNKLLASIFTNPKSGHLFAAGEQINTRNKLADTLRILANSSNPLEIFYKGEIARSISKEFEKNNGRLTFEDFNNYKSIIRSDKDIIYTKLPNGRTICGPPPPSGSAVTQGIINILSKMEFNLTTISGSVDYFHSFIEASKFAYSIRDSLGDIDFVANSLNLSHLLTSQEWAENVRNKITLRTHPDSYYQEGNAHQALPEDHGTSHISVIDRWGNAVSITTTLNIAFGSFVLSESTGILFNDQMDDFSTKGMPNYWGYPPSPQNYIEPGKRPMSSMSPIIVFKENGKETLAIGASGGSTIISGVASTTFNILKIGMNIKEAIDFPRLHNQFRPNFTMFEERIPEKLKEGLQERGHYFNNLDWLNVVVVVMFGSEKKPRVESRDRDRESTPRPSLGSRPRVETESRDERLGGLSLDIPPNPQKSIYILHNPPNPLNHQILI
uniref:Gamma-glutamyltransferase n=1 Tax=Meloidogyne incognita TaxID=6306 RepID=A0A914LQK1_MELIC